MFELQKLMGICGTCSFLERFLICCLINNFFFFLKKRVLVGGIKILDLFNRFFAFNFGQREMKWGFGLGEVCV